MNKGSVHVGDALNDVLQALSKVMRIAKTRFFVENDIHLHIERITSVIRLKALDLFDGVGEAHGQVEQDAMFVRAGRHAHQILDVQGRGSGPVDDDEKGEQYSTKRIEPPLLGVVSNYTLSQPLDRRV